MIYNEWFRDISIHALREEGDGSAFNGDGRQDVFLSTPSARRATCHYTTLCFFLQVFLSTPSARRATSNLKQHNIHGLHFYPRPPRGGRPIRARARNVHTRISIHALREEGDCRSDCLCSVVLEFLSTPSARRATTTITHFHDSRQFLSTPSARRATVVKIATEMPPSNFYPRPPRGGRPGE